LLAISSKGYELHQKVTLRSRTLEFDYTDGSDIPSQTSSGQSDGPLVSSHSISADESLVAAVLFASIINSKAPNWLSASSFDALLELSGLISLSAVKLELHDLPMSTVNVS
jgi:hypothetical protein